MTRDYAFDQGFAQERKRLSAMEFLWDPGSQALLDDLGLGPGWRCLEVGAGGGSMMRWMADRGANVMAVDIDTRFIDSSGPTQSGSDGSTCAPMSFRRPNTIWSTPVWSSST